MRIIAGEFRHRKLLTPRDGAVTRPIPDRVKESLFSILRGWTEAAVIVDAFAGTGAIGFEAISRGAARCVFLEKDRRAADLIRKNAEALGCEERCEIVCADALGTAMLTRCPRPVDLVFFDPPYPLVEDRVGWARVQTQLGRVVALLSDQGYAVLRTPWPFRQPVGDEPATVPSGRRRDRRRGGDRPAEWDGDEWMVEIAAPGTAKADEVEAEPEAADSSSISWQLVDLKVAGALGPETHVYGHTAVHLYMRDRGGAVG